LAMDERELGREDVVVGISASGRAAFVRGALWRAREIGAQSILLTCNGQLAVDAGVSAKCSSGGRLAATPDFDLLVNLKTGPEIVAGSARLKAGTATKV